MPRVEQEVLRMRRIFKCHQNSILSLIWTLSKHKECRSLITRVFQCKFSTYARTFSVVAIATVQLQYMLGAGLALPLGTVDFAWQSSLHHHWMSLQLNRRSMDFKIHLLSLYLLIGHMSIQYCVCVCVCVYIYIYIYVCFVIFVAQQPSSGLVHPILEASRLHTHTHRVGLLCTSDQSLAEAATYTTHNKHKRRKFMFPLGFEPAMPASERPQTYFLDRTAAGIGETLILITPFQSLEVTKS